MERRPECLLFYSKSDTVKYCSASLYHSHYIPYPGILIGSTIMEKEFLPALTIPRIIISTSVSDCCEHNSFSIKKFSHSPIQFRLNKRSIHYQSRETERKLSGVKHYLTTSTFRILMSGNNLDSKR